MTEALRGVWKGGWSVSPISGVAGILGRFVDTFGSSLYNCEEAFIKANPL
jgi:hypothetical protein